jgi:predicted molibdopterin-dependent oxidoreductase YjgC
LIKHKTIKMKEERLTTCFLCSLGCGLTITRGEDRVYYQPIATNKLEYQLDNPINRGSLCGKSNYLFELLSHPNRILGPQILTSSEHRDEHWEKVTSYIIEQIAELADKYGEESIGIMLSPCLTVEETEQAIDLARLIGTPHIDYCSLEDKPILAKTRQGAFFRKRLPGIEEIERMRTAFIVGDLFGVSPVLSRHFLKAKYDQRANRLVVLESSNSHTGWFADLHLQASPGTEVMILTGILKFLFEQPGELKALPWKATVKDALDTIDIADICKVTDVSHDQIQFTADLLMKEKPSIVTLVSGFGVYDRADFVAALCQALADATDSYFLPVFTGANSLGIHEAIANFKPTTGMTASEMVEAAEQGSLKVLLNFGVDIIRTFPSTRAINAIQQLDFLLSTAIFPNDTTAISHVVLPEAPWIEKAGTSINMFGNRLKSDVVLPPPGHIKTTGEILSLLIDGLREKGFKGKNIEPPEATIQESEEDFAAHIIEIRDLIKNYLALGFEENQRILVPNVDFAHSGDGTITQYLSWSQRMSPEPLAIIAKGDNGAQDSKMVRIRSGEIETTIPVKVGQQAKKGMIVAPVHFPQIRSLLNWEILPQSGYLNIKPTKVTVEFL